MKKLLIYPALVLSLVACNNNKAEKEAEINSATAAAIDTLNSMQERARLQDSMIVISDATVVPSPTLIPEEPSNKKPRKSTPSPKEKKENTGTAGTGDAPASTPTPVVADDEGEKTASSGKGDEPAAGEEEKKKKGVNNTVKGAIIGAGAGAVGGAIINKENRGKGAIIGGVIGAGAGAVTGVILDKNKKKKEAAKDSASAKSTTKDPDGK